MKNMGAAAERSHRKCSFLLGLAVFTCGLSLSAHGESDLNTCIGVDFDAKRPLIASGRPAENWKAAGEVTPLQNVPGQGTLLATGVIASSELQIDQVATCVRMALPA